MWCSPSIISPSKGQPTQAENGTYDRHEYVHVQCTLFSCKRTGFTIYLVLQAAWAMSVPCVCNAVCNTVCNASRVYFKRRLNNRLHENWVTISERSERGLAESAIIRSGQV